MARHSRVPSSSAACRCVAIVLCTALIGCVLAPRAADEQRAAVARAGEPYRVGFDERTLPAIPATPTRRDVVQRALAANGDVEAAYFDWAAAVHRIDRAGAYPNTAFSLDLSRALSGRGSAFDRTSLTLGFDPMENLAFPTKVYQAAKVATAEAEAAQQRLVVARFDVQRRALAAWIAYVVGAERVRVAEDALGLTDLAVRSTMAQVGAGAARTDLLQAQTSQRRAEDDMATLVASQVAARARVNALLARSPDAALAAPAQLEAPRTVPLDDAWVLAVAAEHDPTLAALARDVEGRRDALELARQRYIPDFNPFVGTDGAAAQVAGMVISIPTMLREVGAQIRETRATLQTALARQRQTRADRAAALVTALVMVRDGDRRLAFLDGPLRTIATETAASAVRTYATGDGAVSDVLAARRTMLDVRQLYGEAWAARENAVADLETLIGVDTEALVAAEATHTGQEPAADPLRRATERQAEVRFGGTTQRHAEVVR